jgi:hypothetical protein
MALGRIEIRLKQMGFVMMVLAFLTIGTLCLLLGRTERMQSQLDALQTVKSVREQNATNGCLDDGCRRGASALSC